LQFRPSDDLSLTLDLMRGSFKDEEDDYLFGSWSGDATAARDLTIDANGVVTRGTFDNTQHEFKSYDRHRDEDYTQASLNMNWLVGDWQIDALAGISTAESRRQNTQAKWIRYAPLTQEYSGNGMIRSSEAYDLANDVTDYTFEFWDFDNTKVDD